MIPNKDRVKVSPTQPTTGEKVWLKRSNNLLKFIDETQTVNGLVITNNLDGSLTLNGTTTDVVSIRLSSVMKELSAGTYYLSRNSEGTVSDTFTNILYAANDTAVNIASLTSEGMICTATVDYEEYYLWFYVKAGVTFTDYIIKPQLEAGTKATEPLAYNENSAIYIKNGNGVYEEILPKSQKKSEWTTFADTNLSYRKVDTTVEVLARCTLNVTMANGLWITLGILPEGYRTPLQYFPFPVMLRKSDDGSYVLGLGHILSDGTVRVSQKGNGSIAVDSAAFFITFSTIPS